MRFYLFCAICFVVIVFTACKPNGNQQEPKEMPSVTGALLKPSVGDTQLVFQLGSFECNVKIHAAKSEFKGTILLLQGWNFPNTSWCDSTDFCSKAAEAGYYIVAPDMGKSIYHKRMYASTREDWKIFPTRTWLMEVVVQKLQTQFDLFEVGGNNYVIGLSTGGRGAVILAEEYPQLFRAGVSLSGDYDQSAFPNDNLYRGYFGTDSTQWSPDENPVSFLESWKTPLFIAHGTADSIVPIAHAIHLKEMLHERNPTLNVTFDFSPSGKHDYAFWGSYTDRIFQFFGENRR